MRTENESFESKKYRMAGRQSGIFVRWSSFLYGWRKFRVMKNPVFAVLCVRKN